MLRGRKSGLENSILLVYKYKCFARSHIKMAVVECDFKMVLHPLCLCVVVHTCMATFIFEHEVLLQLFPVQYYSIPSLKSAY